TPAQEVLIASSTTKKQLLAGFAGVEADDTAFWINGYEPFSYYIDKADYEQFFVVTGDTKVKYEYVGAKLSLYDQDDDNYIDHVVVEINFPAKVTSVNSKTGKYNIELLGKYSFNTPVFDEVGINYTGVTSTHELKKDDVVTVVPQFAKKTADATVFQDRNGLYAKKTDEPLDVNLTTASGVYTGYTNSFPYIWNLPGNSKTDSSSTWTFTDNLGEVFSAIMAFKSPSFLLDENGFIVWYSPTSANYKTPDTYYLAPIAEKNRYGDFNGAEGNYTTSVGGGVTTLLGNFELYGRNAVLYNTGSKYETADSVTVVGALTTAPAYYGLDKPDGYIKPGAAANKYWSGYTKPANVYMMGSIKGATESADPTYYLAVPNSTIDDSGMMGALAATQVIPDVYLTSWLIYTSLWDTPVLAYTDTATSTTVRYELGQNVLLADNDRIYTNGTDRDNFLATLTPTTQRIYVYFSLDANDDPIVNAIWRITETPGTPDTSKWIHGTVYTQAVNNNRILNDGKIQIDGNTKLIQGATPIELDDLTALVLNGAYTLDLTAIASLVANDALQNVPTSVDDGSLLDNSVLPVGTKIIFNVTAWDEAISELLPGTPSLVGADYGYSLVRLTITGTDDLWKQGLAVAFGDTIPYVSPLDGIKIEASENGDTWVEVSLF
ncbi:MAG: hypothetical protein LBC38_03810, partial [Oscillospiraceae bacterium]|nr:hypothetical protein [Oscillospiraceae bacterium]